jgi:hypothetical protein
MKRGFIFVWALLSLCTASAETPCKDWATNDFEEAIKSDWLFELWSKGKNGRGGTYSDRVPGDISDKDTIQKTVENYGLENAKGARRDHLLDACRSRLVQNGKISPTNILNEYVNNLYSFHGCGKKFKRRPSSDAKGAYDARIDPNPYIRRAFANELFKNSKGTILYVPGGKCVRGSHCEDSALIKYTDSGGNVKTKRIELDSAYFHEFCSSQDGVEKHLKSVQAALANDVKACSVHFLSSVGLIGSPPGTDRTFDDLGLSIDSKEQIHVDIAKVNVTRSPDQKSESYSLDSTHVVSFSRDSSGRIVSMTVLNHDQKTVTTFDRSAGGCEPQSTYVETPSGKRLVYEYGACKEWSAVNSSSLPISPQERSVLKKLFMDKNGFGSRIDSNSWKSVLSSSVSDSRFEDDWGRLSKIVRKGCNHIAGFFSSPGVSGKDATGKQSSDIGK